MASASAASSIRSPRAVLMIRMPFFARASRSALTMCRVCGVRRHVQRDVVGAGEQVVERHQLDAEVGGHLLGDERIVRDDAHAERRGAARHLLADAAEAGEAERLVAHLLAEKLLLLPLALLHRRVGGRQVARQRQDQAHRQLGDADAVGAGRVHDDDAARAGGGHVDVVDAGAGAGDRAQLRRGGDDGGRDLGGAADDDARRRRRDRRRAGRARGRCGRRRSQPSARSRSSAEAGRSSATTIFNGIPR